MPVTIVNNSDMPDTSSPSATFDYYETPDCKIATYTHQSSHTVAFGGVTTNENILGRITGEEIRKVVTMLKRAINNRTIERDYFKRYCEMLMGELTEEEFERELDTREEDYVVAENYKPTADDLRLALELCEGIKDVRTSQDLSSLFSFNVNDTEKLLGQ